jgi:hypothetical protein
MSAYARRHDEPIALTAAASRRASEAVPPHGSAPRSTDGFPSPDSLPATVRRLRPRDLPALRALDPLHVLERPETTVVRWRPLRDALTAIVPGTRRRRPAFVVESGNRVVGYARFATTPPDDRWTLLALGSAVGVYDADPVWEALLTTAVRQAGLSGVRSLYARVPWTTGAAPLFARLNWQAYATETVFLAQEARAVSREALRPRPMEPGDTWAVHQLYAAAVPQAVQQAEAFTSRRWEGAARGRRGAVTGLLFEDGWQAIGFARVTAGPAGRGIDLLVHPEHRHLASPMLYGVLATLAPGGRRLWVALRGYQDELAGPLEARGFLPVFEQELFVRYTTARLRRPAAEFAPFALEVRERAARQAPTFLAGVPDDGAAPRA